LKDLRPAITMDLSDPYMEDGNVDEVYEDAPTGSRQLPADLPKSLDDRQPVRSYGGETEMYDAWQGRVRTPNCSMKSGVQKEPHAKPDAQVLRNS
jgi:hypothetical protein